MQERIRNNNRKKKSNVSTLGLCMGLGISVMKWLKELKHLFLKKKKAAD